jgi:gas vesicle protein
MNTGKAFLGVLVGITAGAALGILFAPQKGSNTRKKIVRKGEDLVDTLDEKINEKFDEFVDMFNKKVKKNRSQNIPVTSTEREMAE